MNDPFAGMPDVIESGASTVSAFAGIPDEVGDPFKGLPDVVTPDGPVSAFRAKLADPKEYARIKRWAAYHGTTPEDPTVERRLTNPRNFIS